MLESILICLKLGLLSFGGPAAHLAMMFDEFVIKRKWVSEEDYFSDMAITNMIPGPSSTQQIMAIGYERFGFKGLFAFGTAFIVPPMLIVMVVTHFFNIYQSIPLLGFFIIYMGPSLFAYITYISSKMIAKHKEHYIIMICSIILRALGVNEVIILIGVVLVYYSKQKLLSLNLWALFLGFVRIGMTLYGSGYALLGYGSSVFGAGNYQTWLLAFTIGESTPGPIFTTATAFGMMMQGPLGALLSTFAIFLPSFIFLSILLPLKSKVKINHDLLKAVNAAAMSFIIYAIIQYLISQPVMIFIYIPITILMFMIKEHHMVVSLLIALLLSLLKLLF